MTPTPTNGCGRKHLGLAMWIIFPVLGLCVTIALAIGSTYANAAKELEPRVRIIEVRQGGHEEHFRAIESSLSRIERKLDDEKGAKP